MSTNALPSGLLLGRLGERLKVSDGLAGRVLTAALTLGLTAVLSLAYAHVAWTVPINSDHASILLEADDVIHGNCMLRGWMLTALTFYTTDLPFYVLGMALRGFSPALLREVPAVIYALTVVAAVALAGRGPIPERRLLGRLVTFVLLGLPALIVPQIVLVGVNHIATTLFMVLSLLALNRAGEEAPRTRTLAAFGVLLLWTVFGDGMASVILVAPLLAVSLARVYQRRDCWKDEQRVLIPILAAIPLAKLAQTLIHLAGGFRIADPTMQITFLRTLPENVGVTIRSLLSFYRADFFGKDVGLETVGMLVGFLALGFVLYSFRQGLGVWQNGRLGTDRTSEVLTVAMAVNLAAYLLDYDVVKGINTLYSPPERYLVPFFVFGAVLAGRLGTAHVADLRRFKVGLAAVGLAYSAFFLQQLTTAPLTMPAERLTRWLQVRGLTDGYGNFWCSNVVASLSGGQIRVRAVTADSGRMMPMRWFSKRQWYEAHPAHFVCSTRPPSRKALYWGHVDLTSSRGSFGTPDEVDRVGQYTVLIWKKTSRQAWIGAKTYDRDAYAPRCPVLPAPRLLHPRRSPAHRVAGARGLRLGP